MSFKVHNSCRKCLAVLILAGQGGVAKKKETLFGEIQEPFANMHEGNLSIMVADIGNLTLILTRVHKSKIVALFCRGRKGRNNFTIRLMTAHGFIIFCKRG